MYAALWRILPGPTWLKTVQAVVWLAVTLTLLFVVVFPIIAEIFFAEPSTVSQ